MNKLLAFLKKELVLVISALAALISSFFVPPDASYLGYVNWSVLSMLFCLMAVIAGFGKSGVLTAVSSFLTNRFHGTRLLGAALVFLCFASSMLITNDVALLTFVPVAMAALSGASERTVIYVVAAETVAANLGSLATPVGNPQNLFLYSYFGLTAGEFFSITLPIAAASLALVAILTLFIPNEKASASPTQSGIGAAAERVDVRGAVRFAILFILCLLTVFKVLDYRLLLGIVALALLVFDRDVFRRVDYLLLLTFVCFFVFSGNLARISAVRDAMPAVMGMGTTITSAAVSQVISNVPAAIMLSSFTDDAAGLIAGTNVGGLGTLIASLASLISYKLYASRAGSKRGKYFLVFTVMNVILLAALLAFCLLLGY